MAQWTRGDKIAFWALVVAIVSCPLLYQLPAVKQLFQNRSSGGGPSTVQPNQDKVREDLASAQAAIVSAMNRKLEEEVKAGREEALRLHEQRIEVRKRRLSRLRTEFHSAEKPQFFRVTLVNKCPSVISVALSYKDLADDWITRGWWNLEPGQTLESIAETRNSNVYFFAEDQEDGGTWNGEGDTDSIRLFVTDRRFYHVNSEAFPYQEPKSVVFFHRDAGERWKEHVQWFTCNGT